MSVLHERHKVGIGRTLCDLNDAALRGIENLEIYQVRTEKEREREKERCLQVVKETLLLSSVRMLDRPSTQFTIESDFRFIKEAADITDLCKAMQCKIKRFTTMWAFHFTFLFVCYCFCFLLTCILINELK